MTVTRCRCYSLAFSAYKSSPAAKRGVVCQDCHMGKEPGRYTGEAATNYAWGPAARLGKIWTAPRKLTNHMIVGPDFSIIHPGLFPLQIGAIQEANAHNHSTGEPVSGLATIREWLQFNWQTGWGTDKFEDALEDALEDAVTDASVFPLRWASADDRYDARMIIDENRDLLEQAKQSRLTLLRNGYQLGESRIEHADDTSIRLAIQVKNGTDGHPVPTSLDAERPVWLHVRVTDRHGRLVMESGDLDPNGDVQDRHSAYVRNHELPLDPQLFNLQSRFITRNIRGGEREDVLTVPFSLGPLPFVRPAQRATVLLGRSLSMRKHKHNIAPLGERWAVYRVVGQELDKHSPYRVEITLNAGMVPVSLINAIKGVGFDYDMSPRQVAQAVVAEHVAIWRRELTVSVSNTATGQQ